MGNTATENRSKKDNPVYNRKEAEHWEADTLVHGQGKEQACFSTPTKRKTQFYIAMNIPNQRSATMEHAIVLVLTIFHRNRSGPLSTNKKQNFPTGAELKNGCKVYFASLYCAWQKGTNENPNGLLQEFYPKCRKLSRIAPATLKRGLALINARPREVLVFHSTQEFWNFKLNSRCT